MTDKQILQIITNQLVLILTQILIALTMSFFLLISLYHVVFYLRICILLANAVIDDNFVGITAAQNLSFYFISQVKFQIRTFELFIWFDGLIIELDIFSIDAN